MITLDDEIRITPTTAQQCFIDLDCREALFLGGPGIGKTTALLLSALKHIHFVNYSAIVLRSNYSESDNVLDSFIGKYLNKSRSLCEFPSGAKLQFAVIKEEHDVLRFSSTEFQFIGFDNLSTFALHHDVNPYQFMLCRLRNHNDLMVPLRMRATDSLVGMSPNHEVALAQQWVRDRFLPDREVVRG